MMILMPSANDANDDGKYFYDQATLDATFEDSGYIPASKCSEVPWSEYRRRDRSRSAEWLLIPRLIISLLLQVPPLAAREAEVVARPCVDVAPVHSCRLGHDEPAEGNGAAGVDSGGGIVAGANRILHA